MRHLVYNKKGSEYISDIRRLISTKFKNISPPHNMKLVNAWGDVLVESG